MARALVLLFALSIAAEASASQSGWHRLTPKSGESADTTIIGYGVEAMGDSVEPALLVCRCRAGELELFLIAESTFVVSHSVQGERVIDEFLDAAPARSERWVLSTDQGALFAPDAGNLAERLVGTGRLWLGFGKSRGLEFNVRGFEQPWKALLAACPPRPPAPRPSDTNPTLPQFGEYVQVDDLPQAIRKVNPIYPPEAKAQRMEGTVIVQALLGPDGLVKDTRVVKSIPVFDASAADAVRQWTFKPAMTNGKPVAVWVAVPVKFSLP